MESMKDVLGRFHRETGTPTPRTIGPDQEEPTREERRERLRVNLGISTWENTFESFKPSPGTEEAWIAFRDLAAGGYYCPMLLCYGGVGNGKTHLCEAAAIELHRRGIFCRVLTYARMMTALKETMRPDSKFAYAELIDRYCTTPHLIVDDVGMGGSGSFWEQGQLEEIVVARYRERLFTIMTTNRDLEDLPERVVSRFRDREIGRLVLNEGADYRPKKEKGGN